MAFAIDRQHVRDMFASYVANYDASDSKVSLKIIHTYHVADMCDAISDSLSLTNEDRDTAWLCGMLHDIGRFEQLRRYGTFFDKRSVNHAALSADLLFHDGLIRSFTEDFSKDALVEKAIRLHNVFQLPENLTDQELLFCNILRDADKIDIIRVNRETPMSEIYDLPEEEFYTTPISDRVYDAAIQRMNVNREYSKTAVDYMIGHICFVYGLVFPESFRQVTKQGYLDQMLQFQSRNPETAERFSHIREAILSYVNSRLYSTSIE